MLLCVWSSCLTCDKLAYAMRATACAHCYVVLVTVSIQAMLRPPHNNRSTGTICKRCGHT